MQAIKSSRIVSRGPLPSMVRVLLSTLLCVSTGACRQQAPTKQAVVSSSIAPGHIEVEIDSPGSEGDLYRRYRLTPSRGAVELMNADQHRSPYLSPRMDCFERTVTESPDFRFIAT